MTLNILDEKGQIVDENNPIIIEHNGTLGDVVNLSLTLINNSIDRYYRNINMHVNTVLPIKSAILIAGEKDSSYEWKKIVWRLDPRQQIKFILQTVVPPNTSERVVRGINLVVSGVRYPIP